MVFNQIRNDVLLSLFAESIACCIFSAVTRPSSTKRRMKPVNLGKPFDTDIPQILNFSIVYNWYRKIILLLHKNTISESVVTTLISIKSMNWS